MSKKKIRRKKRNAMNWKGEKMKKIICIKRECHWKRDS